MYNKLEYLWKEKRFQKKEIAFFLSYRLLVNVLNNIDKTDANFIIVAL